MNTDLSITQRKKISEGITAFEVGRLDEALEHFKGTALTPFGPAEPWFWMGRVYEEKGDRALAGHCFYMVCDLNSRSKIARAALKRLGYLGNDALGTAQAGPAKRFLEKIRPSIQGVKP